MRKLGFAAVAAMLLIPAAMAGAGALNNGVPQAAYNGVAHASKADGSLRPNSVGHLQIRNRIVSCEKFSYDLARKLCNGDTAVSQPGVAGPTGPAGKDGANGKDGVNGTDGRDGKQGPRGDGQVLVIADTPGVCYTNPSVSLTSGGAVFGPYTSNEQGGSVCVDLGPGHHLADLAHLTYTASFSATTDNGDAPYLRVFLNGDADDVIFAPSTQPGACYGPAPIVGAGSQCKSRGRMILYTVENGTVRYDDDPGSAPDVSWASVINAHGSDTIDAIYVTSGFALPDTTGAVLNSISYEIAGSNPVTLAFAH